MHVNDLERDSCCLLVDNIQPFGLKLKNITRNRCIGRDSKQVPPEHKIYGVIHPTDLHHCVYKYRKCHCPGQRGVRLSALLAQCYWALRKDEFYHLGYNSS
jgi:hypothetical protein